MAKNKSTRSRKRKKAVPSRLLRFPEVKGKIVEAVEIDPDVEAICIAFPERDPPQGGLLVVRRG